MSQVGEFPGLNTFKRRMIRGPINPYDKATVISIYPKELDEKKSTIEPGRFVVKPGNLDKPAILVVGPSSWWREIDEDQPLLEIPVGAIQVAEAIVRDYCNGIFACDMSSAMPGLFYVPGEKSLDEIRKSFSKELLAAEKRQKNWYSVLIRAADSLWARSNGNPLAISDDMRMAARELGQLNKDWLKDFQMVDMVRCVACGTLKNPQFPICAACGFADPQHPLTKELLAQKAALQAPKQ